jgi:hypothetical protein
MHSSLCPDHLDHTRCFGDDQIDRPAPKIGRTQALSSPPHTTSTYTHIHNTGWCGRRNHWAAASWVGGRGGGPRGGLLLRSLELAKRGATALRCLLCLDADADGSCLAAGTTTRRTAPRHGHAAVGRRTRRVGGRAGAGGRGGARGAQAALHIRVREPTSWPGLTAFELISNRTDGTPSSQSLIEPYFFVTTSLSHLSSAW